MLTYAKRNKPYKRIKYLGLYSISTRDSIYILFLCDNNQILVESLPREPLVFIDQEFADNYLIKLPSNSLLETLYAIR